MDNSYEFTTFLQAQQQIVCCPLTYRHSTMNNLIDKTFNLIRSVLLGIAVAFLIVPYTNMPVYAHDDDPRYWPGDLDADNISNRKDVCIRENYNDQYHRECLQGAGLSFRNLISDRELAVLLYFAPQYSTIINLLGGSITAKYQQAAIRTCDDLKDFENNNDQIAKRFRNLAWLVGIVGGLLAGAIAALSSGFAGLTAGSVVIIITGALSLGSMVFGDLADAAGSAHDQLCTPQYR